MSVRQTLGGVCEVYVKKKHNIKEKLREEICMADCRTNGRINGQTFRQPAVLNEDSNKKGKVKNIYFNLN